MNDFREMEARRRHARSSYMDVKKHYVRMMGWLPVLKRYAASRKGGVRYFSLCAKLALDIRYFRRAGVLPYDDQEKRYPTVGFVEQEAQDYATISETLGKTRLGIHGNLERVLLRPDECPEDSQALKQSLPYDVVNLDFTGDVIPVRDAPYSSTIRGIEKLVALQMECGARDWHMFLTFRACRSTANEEATTELLEILESNLREREALAAYGDRPRPSVVRDSEYQEFLRVGFAKYLAGSAAHAGLAMTLEGSYVYPRQPVNGPPYHIVKLIVGFSPLRSLRELPDRAAEHAAYRRAVPAILRSASVDVAGALANVSTKRAVSADLAQLIREVKSLGVVS